jgi:hypothetical protein
LFDGHKLLSAFAALISAGVAHPAGTGIVSYFRFAAPASTAALAGLGYEEGQTAKTGLGSIKQKKTVNRHIDERNGLCLAGREEFLELAGVKPDAVAIGACVQDHRTIDAAIDAQQFCPVSRAFSPFTVALLVFAAASQRCHLAGIFGQ